MKARRSADHCALTTYRTGEGPEGLYLGGVGAGALVARGLFGVPLAARASPTHVHRPCDACGVDEYACTVVLRGKIKYIPAEFLFAFYTAVYVMWMRVLLYSIVYNALYNSALFYHLRLPSVTV